MRTNSGQKSPSGMSGSALHSSPGWLWSEPRLLRVELLPPRLLGLAQVWHHRSHRKTGLMERWAPDLMLCRA